MSAVVTQSLAPRLVSAGYFSSQAAMLRGLDSLVPATEDEDLHTADSPSTATASIPRENMVLPHPLLRDVFIFFVVVVTTNKQSHVFQRIQKHIKKKKVLFLMTGWCVLRGKSFICIH